MQVRLHVDPIRGRLYVDLVNRNWAPGAGQLIAAGPQELTVSLPSWLQGISFNMRTAGSRGVATGVVTSEGDAVQITVDAVEDLVTVILESPL